MFYSLSKIRLIVLSIILLTALIPHFAFALTCGRTGGYNIENGTVYYQERGRSTHAPLNIFLQGVDLPSFTPLKSKTGHWTSCVNPYARDKNYVFYQGKIIRGVQGSTFRVLGKAPTRYTDGHVIVMEGVIIGKMTDTRKELGGGYFRLGGNYFFKSRQLPEPIIKLVGRSYAIGRRAVYYNGKAISFDPRTFEIKGSYLRDRNGIYCGKSRQKLDADPATFTVHYKKQSFATDKNHYFFECKKISQATGRSLDLFDHGFLRDTRHVYFMNKPVSGLDPASFVLHFQGGKYIQDKNGVYYIKRKNFQQASISFVKIEGADPETFQATGFSKARDMMSLYKKEKRISDNWDGLKQNSNAIFRVKRKRLYKFNMPSSFVDNFEGTASTSGDTNH